MDLMHGYGWSSLEALLPWGPTSKTFESLPLDCGPHAISNLISFVELNKKIDTYVEISCNFSFVFIFGW